MRMFGWSLMNGSRVSVVLFLLAGCSGSGGAGVAGAAGTGGGSGGNTGSGGGGGSTGSGGGGSTGRGGDTGSGGGGSTGSGGSVAVNPAVKAVIDSCAWLTGCLNTEDSGSAAPSVTLSACIGSWLAGNEYPWAATKACVAAQPTSCSAFRQCLIGRNAICVGDATTEWTRPVSCADGTPTCSTNYFCAGPCSPSSSQPATCLDATHQGFCLNNQMTIRDCSKLDFGAWGGPGTGVCVSGGPLAWCNSAPAATGSCGANGASCEADIYVSCVNGFEYRRDCAAIGQACGSAGCVQTTGCSDSFGMCSGNTYQGCFAGNRINVDCVALGGACGMNRAWQPGCVFPEGTGGTGGAAGAGGAGGTGGTGGTGGPELKAENLISDFEQTDAAIVAMAGNPTRNGVWFAYNDDTPKGADATCVQTPLAAPQTPDGQWAPYGAAAPPGGVRPGSTGLLALHGSWTGCTIWGAGIGANLNQPGAPDGGPAPVPVPYDVTPFTGVTFWARAAVGSDTALRIKFTMTDETMVEWGGLCVESATNKCSDDYGEKFNLPSNGTWKQVTVRWSDAAFAQEGWGAVFPWNPQHVLGIQIQSVDKVETYDFWIDDLYFIN